MPYEKNKTAYQDEEWFEREQREELVNTQNRESYFSFGVESTHRYGCSFFMPSFKEREEKRNPHILKKVSLHAAPEKERYT